MKEVLLDYYERLRKSLIQSEEELFDKNNNKIKSVIRTMLINQSIHGLLERPLQEIELTLWKVIKDQYMDFYVNSKVNKINLSSSLIDVVLGMEIVKNNVMIYVQQNKILENNKATKLEKLNAFKEICEIKKENKKSYIIFNKLVENFENQLLEIKSDENGIYCDDFNKMSQKYLSVLESLEEKVKTNDVYLEQINNDEQDENDDKINTWFKFINLNNYALKELHNPNFYELGNMIDVSEEKEIFEENFKKIQSNLSFYKNILLPKAKNQLVGMKGFCSKLNKARLELKNALLDDKDILEV